MTHLLRQGHVTTGILLAWHPVALVASTFMLTSAPSHHHIYKQGSPSSLSPSPGCYSANLS